ncbi:MAG: phosphohistidine phosphatase SixA [Proteobacteria bacterium]|nr:phosphohistidine phosphatase SixA [Pseudomonadota bacterium]
MRVYIVRHGNAVDAEQNPTRPLSERGRRDVQRMASFLGRAQVRVVRVVHSGKTRAAQTALLLAEVLGPGKLVEEMSLGLNPGDEPEPAAKAIQGWTGDSMLVGHLPHLGRLVAYMTAGDDEKQIVDFATGAVACLERGDNGNGWRLRWMMEPKLLGS